MLFEILVRDNLVELGCQYNENYDKKKKLKVSKSNSLSSEKKTLFI